MASIVWPAVPSGRMAAIQALVFRMSQTQWWTPERLRARQLRQVQALINHAAKTVPFYADRLGDGAGLAPGRLSMDAFRRLPLLMRTDVQDVGDSLVTRTLPGGHGKMFDVSTTGSTGRPVTVKGTHATSLMAQAMGLRYHQWHKRDLGAKDLTIRTVKGKRSIVRRRSWVSGIPGEGSVMCDITCPIGQLFDTLIEEAPDYLQTHPNVVLGLVQRSMDAGVKPVNLREVRTFGEPVDSALRVTCREEWNVPVTDLYSSMEMNAIALQCPDHTHYHVQSENVLLEILDDAGAPCPPGHLGRVVVTALNNFASPLIRYELGDMAEMGESCSCGRGLPVLRRIAGRSRNLVTLPSGEKVFPEIGREYVLVTLPIRQFQITQKTTEVIEIKLAVTRPLTKDEEKELCDYFTRLFLYAFDYRFVYVDEIPRAAGGKYETFRSEVTTP